MLKNLIDMFYRFFFVYIDFFILLQIDSRAGLLKCTVNPLVL